MGASSIAGRPKPCLFVDRRRWHGGSRHPGGHPQRRAWREPGRSSRRRSLTPLADAARHAFRWTSGGGMVSLGHPRWHQQLRQRRQRCRSGGGHMPTSPATRPLVPLPARRVARWWIWARWGASGVERTAVNNAGQVVGWANTAAGSATRGHLERTVEGPGGELRARGGSLGAAADVVDAGARSERRN